MLLRVSILTRRISIFQEITRRRAQQLDAGSLPPPCHRARSQPATHPQKSLLRKGHSLEFDLNHDPPESMDDVPGDWVRAIGPIYLHACLSCHAHCPYAPCASRVWTTPLSARAVFAGAQLPDRLGPHVQNPSGAHIIYAYVLAHYSCVLYTDCICTLSTPPPFPGRHERAVAAPGGKPMRTPMPTSMPTSTPCRRRRRRRSRRRHHSRRRHRATAEQLLPPPQPPRRPRHHHHHHLKPPTAATATFSRRHRCRHRCQHRCHHR